jgi:lysozyme family protein
MTPSFLKALPRIAEHEGGYVNNPRDPGGPTMFGVTERVARKWGYKGDMRFLPRETANDIFYQEYWLPIRGDDLPFSLAFQLCDMCINSGPVQTTKILQSLLGVPSDGEFGPITLNAVLGKGSSDLATRFLRARHQFLAKLPTWPTFGRGWSSRILENSFYLCEDLFLERSL